MTVFFGPGTGTIYIALFTGLTGMEMVTASGSAKIANLSSNLAALVSMMLSGDVCFPLAIPAMVFSIAGGYLGAKFAIKRGAKAVRVVMLLVLAGILAKLSFNCETNRALRASNIRINLSARRKRMRKKTASADADRAAPFAWRFCRAFRTGGTALCAYTFFPLAI